MDKQENRLSIGRINGVEIFAVKNEEGTVLVPIKPICTALEIDVDSQRQKISEDEDLSSTAVLSTAVGADGKEREMFCLPEKFIYGWLFTINPKNVAASARESVRSFRRQCYNILYDYFNGKSRRQIESNKAEIRILEQLNAMYTQEKEVKAKIRELNSSLAKVRASRLDDQPSLFD